MTEPPRFRLVDAILLLVLLATAAGARVGYLVTYADHAGNSGPFQVQESGPPDDLIVNLKEYHWFGRLAPFAAVEERTADVSPGYPWLLGELERLPLTPGTVSPLVRWFQCGLGTLTVACYFLFARRAFPGLAVAVLTGLFCALHPFWVIETAALNDGTLASFLLAAAVWLGSRGSEANGPLTSLLYGLNLAALALVRAALLPFAVVAVLWFLWRSRSVAGGWQGALLAFLGFVTGMAPWMIRNSDVYQDVYPVVDSTYVHLWEGNNPRATGGPLSERELLESLAEARGEEPGVTANWLAGLPQPERFRALAAEFVAAWQRDPGAALLRRVRAGLAFAVGADFLRPGGKLWRDTPADSEAEDLLSRAPYPAALTGSLLGMLVLAPLGWRWTHAWRRSAMPSSLALMWVPFPYLLGHAEALSGPRLPLDGILLCYAAFALVYLLPRLGAPLRAGESKEVGPAT